MADHSAAEIAGLPTVGGLAWRSAVVRNESQGDPPWVSFRIRQLHMLREIEYILSMCL